MICECMSSKNGSHCFHSQKHLFTILFTHIGKTINNRYDREELHAYDHS